jgi:hypothetical protein
MLRCCAAIGCGAILGLVLLAAAYRISECFDTQLIHF